jgi:hypothetical protein
MTNDRKGTKLLGDAGEHYALSQFSFSGKYAAKMPDNWEAYDLAIETGTGLARVSVKTRSESKGWKTSKWFNFDDRKTCDWFVFIFKPINGTVRSWVIPQKTALRYANKPGQTRNDAWFRDISWAKLTMPPLSLYEDNWQMNKMAETNEDSDIMEEKLHRIIERFNTDREFIVSLAFLDGGIDPLSGRLERAALNQLCEGEATVSRYGIWANTVRDNIRQADVEIEEGNVIAARCLLHRAANSLSAFSELQAQFDTMGIGRTTQHDNSPDHRSSGR